MTNYNKRLDELMPCDCKFLKGLAWREGDPCEGCINGSLKQAITEWHEIEKSEVYNSGCADTAKHILALFDNQIPEQLKRWLRLEIEDRGKL